MVISPPVSLTLPPSLPLPLFLSLTLSIFLSFSLYLSAHARRDDGQIPMCWMDQKLREATGGALGGFDWLQVERQIDR